MQKSNQTVQSESKKFSGKLFAGPLIKTDLNVLITAKPQE